MNDLNKHDLIRATKEYWRFPKKSDLDSCLKEYICSRIKYLNNRSLLEAELDFAKQKGNIENEICKTLILLVGFSLEPLLQSVCKYKPEKIVLLLNEEGYGEETWDVYAKHIVEAVEHLKEKGLILEAPFFSGKEVPDKVGYPIQSSPAAVFKMLMEVLRDEENVVIDITGGKKSMVTGAYMYAAYAGVSISYVDFDEYDQEYRRPYGFTCKIGKLDNPYREFSLREWERVRELYNSYKFREAKELLKNVKDAMKSVIQETEEPIQKLNKFLEYYEKWDSGDFRGAKQVGKELDFFVEPSIVAEFGDQWYEVEGKNFINTPKNFYGNIRMVKLYAYDELNRIRRLIYNNHDYRSAFLRAGGVNEIIMRARLLETVKEPADRDKLLGRLEEWVVGAKDIFKKLVKCEGEEIIIKIKGHEKKGIPDICIKATILSKMKKWWEKTNMFKADNGWKDFLKIRNKLAHRYFSVPREWAQEALKFVEANFEDFLGQPMKELSLCAEAMPWPELCEICGMDKFLPLNLRR